PHLHLALLHLFCLVLHLHFALLHLFCLVLHLHFALLHLFCLVLHLYPTLLHPFCLRLHLLEVASAIPRTTTPIQSTHTRTTLAFTYELVIRLHIPLMNRIISCTKCDVRIFLHPSLYFFSCLSFINDETSTSIWKTAEK